MLGVLPWSFDAKERKWIAFCGWLAAMGPGAACALPVVLMEGESDCSNPGGRLAKNNAGIWGKVPSLCICFHFKLGKNWLFSSGQTNLLKKIHNLKKILYMDKTAGDPVMIMSIQLPCSWKPLIMHFGHSSQFLLWPKKIIIGGKKHLLCFSGELWNPIHFIYTVLYTRWAHLQILPVTKFSTQNIPPKQK